MHSAFRLANQRRTSLVAPCLIFGSLLVASFWAVSTLSAPSLSFELANLMPTPGLTGLLSTGVVLR